MSTAPTVSLPDNLGAPAREFIAGPHRMLIGAERPEAADGRVFATLDPATGREITEVPQAGREDVDRAACAASRGTRAPAARAGCRDRGAGRGARADRVARQRQAGRAGAIRGRRGNGRSPALLR